MTEKASKMSEDKVLLGNMDFAKCSQHTRKESRVVRVFVSSTFTDMSVERNVLMKRTYPRLKEHFRAKGLDFQVVDMRWGVREEAIMENQASKLCVEEIRNSQNISRGTSFLALLGDKYGSCPVPAQMSVRHYRLFVLHLEKAGLPKATIEEWYKLDENAVPPHYLLLPRSEKLPHVHSNNVGDIEQRIEERKKWQADQEQIRHLLQKAASLAQKHGDITEEEKHQYFVAVTEAEITHGILQDPQAKERAICVLRSFDNFKPMDELAWRFADTAEGKVEPGKALLLQRLKQDRLPRALPSIIRHTVQWLPNGIDASDERHAAYLETLSSQVFDAIVEQSEVRIQATERKATADRVWHSDLVHHWDFARQKLELFCGQTKLKEIILRRLRRKEYHHYLPARPKPRFAKAPAAAPKEEEENTEEVDEAKPTKEGEVGMGIRVHKPLVLFGESGFGKTALMAKVAQKMGQSHKRPVWPSAKRMVKVVRFLGTSPLSCSVADVLRSIVRQISGALVREEPELPTSFAHLCDFFHDFLWDLEEETETLFVISLDALDQLSSEDGAYKCLWLPTAFPTNVFLFISCLPKLYGILDSLRGLLPDDRCYVQVISLDALDQLSSEDGAYKCLWLPTAFPTNVFLFISCLPKLYGILDSLRGLLPDDRCYVQVHGMSTKCGWEVVEAYARAAQRTFTPQQMNLITDAFKASPFPMALRLAFELCKDWHSFSDLSTLRLGSTCKELINQLIDRLRLEHGRLASRALKFITASREGLSDEEVEDLLSLDDEILQDVYIYHLPPDPSVIRLPPMLWRRVRHQIREYLVEKEADGRTVVNWYHRHFWESARATLSDTPGVHRHMMYYFAGRWAGTAKPLKLYKGKRAEYPEAQRNVPSQPYAYGEGQANLRKLTELPYHVVKSMDASAASRLLTTFNFLNAKLRFQGLKALLHDFKLFFETFAPGERLAMYSAPLNNTT